MSLPEWMNVSAATVGWLGFISLLTFVGSLLVVPWLIIRLPEDYFTGKRRPISHFKHIHPSLHLFLILIKNLVGITLIAAGIVMLVIPGQGLLTILLGLFLMDFSGKYRLERKLIEQKAVLDSLNWIRQRANKPKLKIHNHDES